jgi:hypothetical protein
VLLLLIATALVALALFGLSMCRLAALSDHNHAVALAEWIATSYLSEHEAAPAHHPSEQIPSDPRDEAFRATG